jgi:hypothetical protein
MSLSCDGCFARFRQDSAALLLETQPR